MSRSGPAMPTVQRSGWQAIIKNGTGPDFREFVLMYHEVGDEAFRPVNKKGEFLPQRDPLTDAYRPGGRAINYRSEPFGINNMQMQHEYFGFEDESMGYSSYTFGDPAPTIPRCYMGDPAKFRLVHGGSEVFHSHHPHGGTIRWPRSPRAIDEMPMWHAAKNGPVKYPVIRAKTDRVDVEVIGPSEAMDLETECGSGLCQQLAGDFLFHCHVAHHYIAGMWGYWRVYNTMQQGDLHNDVMPDLRELPDRKGRIKAPRDVGSVGRQNGRLVRQDVSDRRKGQDELESQSGRREHQGLGGDAASRRRASPATRTMRRARRLL